MPLGLKVEEKSNSDNFFFLNRYKIMANLTRTKKDKFTDWVSSLGKIYFSSFPFDFARIKYRKQYVKLRQGKEPYSYQYSALNRQYKCCCFEPN